MTDLNAKVLSVNQHIAYDDVTLSFTKEEVTMPPDPEAEPVEELVSVIDCRMSFRVKEGHADFRTFSPGKVVVVTVK